MNYWYAAVVPPGKEAEAIRQVEQRGYDTFHPTRTRAHRSARTRTNGRLALMTGYIFIAVESYSALSELWLMPVIWRFLGARRSGRIRPKDMKALREMSDEKAQQPMIDRDEYSVGQFCECINGPLLGQMFYLEDITGNGREKPWMATVTTQFFSSKQTLPLPLGWFRPA